MELIERIGNRVGTWGRARRIAMVIFITLFLSISVGLPLLLAQSNGSLSGAQNSTTIPYLLMGLAFLIYVASFAVIAGFNRDPEIEHRPGVVGGLLVVLGIAGFVLLWLEVIWWILFKSGG